DSDHLGLPHRDTETTLPVIVAVVKQVRAVVDAHDRAETHHLGIPAARRNVNADLVVHPLPGQPIRRFRVAEPVALADGPYRVPHAVDAVLPQHERPAEAVLILRGEGEAHAPRLSPVVAVRRFQVTQGVRWDALAADLSPIAAADVP